MRRLSGARAIRVTHPGGQRIDAHRHDWPLLTIPVLGGYREEIDGGEIAIHPPGRCHANCIHARGMETFSIEFDPAWLGFERLDRSRFFLGGEMALASRRLSQLWVDPSSSDERLRRATKAFVGAMLTRRDRARPAWLGSAAQLAAAHTPTAVIARRLSLHPAWLARAYRFAAGEGLHDTARRRRLEQAVVLLRTTDDPLAEIAAAAGFCDQSHLTRATRALLGRTPREIRLERERLPTA